MRIPAALQGESLKRLSQGAFVGFVATAIVGFNWGGWTLGSTAKLMADKSALSAVVAVLAPMCVEKFQHAADATTQLAELKKAASWQQGTFVRDGGWATSTGVRSTDSAVAETCANLLGATQ